MTSAPRNTSYPSSWFGTTPLLARQLATLAVMGLVTTTGCTDAGMGSTMIPPHSHEADGHGEPAELDSSVCPNDVDCEPGAAWTQDQPCSSGECIEGQTVLQRSIGSSITPPGGIALHSSGAVLFSSENRLIAFSGLGQILWSQGCEKGVGPASVDTDGTIYVQMCGLTALRPDGSILWKADAYGHDSFPPAIGGDAVYATGRYGDAVVAFDKQSGEELWSWEQPDMETPTQIAVAPTGTILFASHYDDAGTLHALSAEGAELWTVALPRGGNYTPGLGGYQLSASSQAVFVAPQRWAYTDAPEVLAFDLFGSPLWTLDITDVDEVHAPVLGADGTLYLVSTNKLAVHAVKPDGTLKWTTQLDTNAFRAAVPVVDNAGNVWVGADEWLFALNASGDVVSERFVGSDIYPHLTLSQTGILYLPSNYGGLQGIYIGEPLAASPWPSFAGGPRNQGYPEL